MIFTKQQIEDYRKLCRELDGIKKETSDAIKYAKDKKFLNQNIKIEREGKEVTVKEKDLWVEVETLGDKAAQAYKVLSDKYPNTFKLAKEQNEKVDEVLRMEKSVFGFNSKAVSLLDYLDMTKAYLDCLLKEEYGFKEKESVEGTAEWGDDDEEEIN